MQPEELNSLLKMNIENVYQDLVSLNKTKHNNNDWAYNNNKFQKIYVLGYDGKNALLGITYKDSWSPFLTTVVDMSYIYLEGNIATSLYFGSNIK